MKHLARTCATCGQSAPTSSPDLLAAAEDLLRRAYWGGPVSGSATVQADDLQALRAAVEKAGGTRQDIAVAFARRSAARPEPPGQ